MMSLLLRNLIFTILGPGLVVGLIPFLMIRGGLDGTVQPLQSYHYIGIMLFVMGFILMLHCIIRFAVDGLGTLSPTDPTKRLVVSGFYRFSRNPMYMGAITMLVGEALFTQQIYLWIYSLIVFLAFNLIILLIEEPRLRKDFGEEYKQYCRNVGRWV